MLGLGIAGIDELVGDPLNMRGGETDEQRKVREQTERLIESGYGQYRSGMGNQYYGTAGENAEEIAKLNAILNDPYFMGEDEWGKQRLSDAERAQIRSQIDTLQGKIKSETQYRPSYYVPQTDYEVSTISPEGYDIERFTPEELKVTGEEEREALNPDRFKAPEYEDAAMQAESEAAKAVADRSAMESQRAALAAVEDIYKQGGLTAIDKARLAEIEQQNQMQERAAREAIMADYERKGQSSSGTELAGRLANQQGSAERQRMASLGVAADAEARAMQAMGLAGSMGRDLAEDVYRRAYQTGGAEDVVNQFNTIGAREVQADERRAADEYVKYHRDILQRDVDRLNQEAIYNTDAANQAGMRNANEQTRANQVNTDWQNRGQMFNAGSMNTMNQWGGNAANQGGMFNTGNQTQANFRNADIANNQISGFNNQQGQIAGSWIPQMGAIANIYGQQPTGDFSNLVQSGWALDQAIGNEVQQWIPWYGGQGAGANPMQTGIGQTGGAGGGQVAGTGIVDPWGQGGGQGQNIPQAPQYQGPQTTRYGY